MRLRTYVVEHNPIIRKNLIDTLKELADITAVETAETEDDGITWLDANRQGWDLAIVDLFSKQGGGLGLLAALHYRPAWQKMVVLSNSATHKARHRCAQPGIDAVFDKSNEIDALVSYCLNQNKGWSAKGKVRSWTTTLQELQIKS